MRVPSLGAVPLTPTLSRRARREREGRHVDRAGRLVTGLSRALGPSLLSF